MQSRCIPHVFLTHRGDSYVCPADLGSGRAAEVVMRFDHSTVRESSLVALLLTYVITLIHKEKDLGLL